MRFEVGKHYEHSRGKKMHILGEVNSDMYYSPCLVAEDLEGKILFLLELAKNMQLIGMKLMKLNGSMN